MRTLTFKPIRYSQHEVAVMTKVANYYAPNLSKQLGELPFIVSGVAEGITKPTPSILKYFDLTSEGELYVCQPK